jgi:hypothetical protein
LFHKLKILTVISLNIFEVICFVIKNKIYTPQYSDVHDYNTTHKHNLRVQFCNTEHSKGRVIIMGTKIFNGPAAEVKNVINFNALRRNLKLFLCNVFYSHQEFYLNNH